MTIKLEVKNLTRTFKTIAKISCIYLKPKYKDYFLGDKRKQNEMPCLELGILKIFLCMNTLCVFKFYVVELCHGLYVIRVW